MKSRHELREAVFKILFQVENTELDYKELLELEQEEIVNSSYVNTTLTEIIDKLEEIDNIISNNFVFQHMKFYIAIFRIRFLLMKL